MFSYFQHIHISLRSIWFNFVAQFVIGNSIRAKSLHFRFAASDAGWLTWDVGSMSGTGWKMNRLKKTTI
jgi:hypothetical protein